MLCNDRVKPGFGVDVIQKTDYGGRMIENGKRIADGVFCEFGVLCVNFA